MDAARYHILRELFGNAVDLPAPERTRYVKENAPDDEIRRAALDLLGAHQEASPVDAFLDSGAGISAPPAGVIGPYRILREIGRGGMGTVYLAERADPAFAQRVAIKVLSRGLDTSDLLRRFADERRILARLQHQGIVRLLDGGATDAGLPYFAMEYVDGSPLIEFSKRQALSIEARLSLMADICDAVEYAHRNLVLHRDLKPANILIDATGYPRLLDFGIAQALDRDTAEESTRTSERRLTLGYASPEQILGRSLSTASDVYSLGVILCELLTGSRPIDVGSGQDISLILHSEPRAPSTLVQDPQTRRRLRGDIDVIVLKAVQKEPERRYPGAGALAEDLRRHLRGHPVAARPDTITYRLAKFARRNRLAVAAGAAGLIAAMLGVGATAYQAKVAATERERAVRRFAETRKLAGALLFEIHDSIMNLPGSTTTRRLIVDRSLEYLDRLLSDPGSDPTLIREVAQAYVRVGDVQGLPRFANLGDRPGAIASYQKALSLRRTIAPAFAADPSFQLDGAQLEQRLGEMEDAGGDLAAASARFRRAVEDGRALLSRPDAPPNALREVATAEALLGDTLGSPLRSNLGDIEGALSHYRAAVDLVNRWLAMDPKSGERRHFSASFQARLGQTLGAAGRSEEAIAELAASIDVLSSLRVDFPNVTPIRRDLALHRRLLASALLDASRPLEALPLLDAAAATARELVAEDPASVMEPQLAATIELTRSRALLDLGRAHAAKRRAEEATRQVRTILPRMSDDRGLGRILARAAIAAGRSEAHLGQKAAALRHSLDAVALAEKLVADNPEDASARIALAEGLALATLVAPPGPTKLWHQRATSLLVQLEREGRLDVGARTLLESLRGGIHPQT